MKKRKERKMTGRRGELRWNYEENKRNIDRREKS